VAVDDVVFAVVVVILESVDKVVVAVVVVAVAATCFPMMPCHSERVNIVLFLSLNGPVDDLNFVCTDEKLFGKNYSKDKEAEIQNVVKKLKMLTDPSRQHSPEGFLKGLDD
jgi:cytochrome c556